jgi:uncharacterized membrane protein
MNFSALTLASPAIITHLLFAILAFGLGAIQLVSTKGTRAHRLLGYIWVVAMIIICVTVDLHRKLTHGGAAEKLDYLEVVHVLIRRPNSSS